LSGLEKMTSARESATDVLESSVEVDGLNIRYSRAGLGPALVLIHGLLGSSFSWRYAIPMLAQKRTVIALDMPGAGFSDCSPGLDAHLSTAARRLSRFLDAMGIQRCDLMGSSYGGATALRLATLEASRINSTVLVAPANPWSMIGRKRLSALAIPGVGFIFPNLSRRLRFMHGYFVRRMYGNPALVSAETLRGYSLPLARPGVFEHAVKIAQSWHQDMRELKAEMHKASEIPTLLMWGSKDRLVDLDSADVIRKNLRISRTVIIEGAGHLPYEEVPAQFCVPVLDFLQTYFPAQVLEREVT
jgi:pimeloyl-ACP methyl ester carboxylesterase